MPALEQIMGLCGSSGGGGASGSRNLVPEQRQDLNDAEPVFRAVGISRKEAMEFLKVYEEMLKNGVGVSHRALRYFRVDHKDYTYFYRTLGMYDTKGKRTFTFPQFVALMWNFCSLDAGGLANWSFRVFFGGEACEEHTTVSQEAVFHMLDVMYGLSKEFDFNPNLDKVNMVQNTHEYDVKRSRALIKKIAGSDGEVNRNEFVKLIRKTPALLMRIISTQKTMRDDCIGDGFWRRVEKQRGGMSLSQFTARIERGNPGTLGSIKSGTGTGSRTSRSRSNSDSKKSKASRYSVESSSSSSKGSARTGANRKSRLDEEEDHAALKMQAIMRAKKDRKAVRKKRAEKKAAQERAELEKLLSEAPSATATETPEANPNGDWVAAWDSTYKAEYYYNMKTEECVWERPSGFIDRR